MPPPDYSFIEPQLEAALPRKAEATHGASNGASNGVLAQRRWTLGRDEEIAVISHELRNSLQVIRGATRALALSAESSYGGNAVVETAQTLIDRHVKLMSRHIEDLVEPQQAGEQSLHPLRIDVRVVMRHAVDSISLDLARRRHHITVALPGQPVWAYADGDRLGQIFSNVLINAAKFTPDGGDIAVVMERVNDAAHVRIRDSGIGIEPAMLSHVFDLFVQGAPLRRTADDGRGIGLAVARNLIELHGGTVTAESEGLGRGSEFTITLPVLSAQMDREALSRDR